MWELSYQLMTLKMTRCFKIPSVIYIVRPSVLTHMACALASDWGYPANRALSAMRKHGGKGPFGRIPSRYEMYVERSWRFHSLLVVGFHAAYLIVNNNGILRPSEINMVSKQLQHNIVLVRVQHIYLQPRPMNSWWRRDCGNSFTLLALCVGIHRSPGGFTSQYGIYTECWWSHCFYMNKLWELPNCGWAETS